MLGFGWLTVGILRLLLRARAWPVVTVFTVALVMNMLDYTFFSAWVYYPLILAVASAAAAREGGLRSIYDHFQLESPKPAG